MSFQPLMHVTHGASAHVAYASLSVMRLPRALAQRKMLRDCRWLTCCIIDPLPYVTEQSVVFFLLEQPRLVYF